MLVVKALFFSSTNENIYYSEEVNAVIYSHADAHTLTIFFFALEDYILGEAFDQWTVEDSYLIFKNNTQTEAHFRPSN